MTGAGRPVVRHAVPGDNPAIAGVLDRVLGEKPYAKRLDLWKWRYDDNPARTDAFPPFLVYEENGRIRGVHGLIPLRMKVVNGELNASCSCDLAVDPAARSAGLKLKLAAMSKKYSPLHVSTSANETASKITLALGGKEVSSGRVKYIKPLKASGLMVRGLWKEGRAGEGLAKAGAALWKPVDWALAIRRRTGTPRRVEGGAVRNLRSFDARFDRFWEETARDHAILTVRDSSYLNWRFVRYPFPGIQCFELVRGEQLLGFAVIHLDRDEDRLPFAAILELAAINSENGALEQLAGEAIRRAADAEAHYMIARAPTSRLGDLYRSIGFMPRGTDHSVISYKNNSDIPEELFAADRSWYLTLGDGDGCYYFGPAPG